MDSLMICMHLTYGQPARATELCSLLYKNHQNAPRHVYWTLQTMMLVTQYHKSRSMTQMNKLIVRFFPGQLALLFKTYLAVVRPMEV
jgi:hypothetical protein